MRSAVNARSIFGRPGCLCEVPAVLGCDQPSLESVMLLIHGAGSAALCKLKFREPTSYGAEEFRGNGAMLRTISTHVFLRQRLHPGLLETLAKGGAQGIEIFAARQHFDYTSKPHVKEIALLVRG